MAEGRAFGERSLVVLESPDAHVLVASLDVFAMKHDAAIAHADRAIELAPSARDANSLAGWVKVVSGQPAGLAGPARRAHLLQRAQEATSRLFLPCEDMVRVSDARLLEYQATIPREWSQAIPAVEEVKGRVSTRWV